MESLLRQNSAQEKKIKSDTDDRDAAAFLEDAVSRTQTFRLEQALGGPDRCPRYEDKRRVSQCVDKEQERPIDDISFLRDEGQEHSQDGDGARSRDDAEEETPQKGADIALFFYPDPGGDRKIQLDQGKQVKPH